MTNLSIFKTRATDKKAGYSFEGFAHSTDRSQMSNRILFKSKIEARQYAIAHNLKPWNF